MYLADSRSPASITCSTVELNAMPCLPYAEGDKPTIDPKCCTGLQNLVATATSKNDKVTACHCLEDAFQKFPAIQDKYMKAIPNLCNVTIPFPLSKDMKCDK
ncbi:unnamed protein product [Linum tenue]|uniref:Non-specific lipid-transfer protein n=2 Tax=Linum tenue TaxID=586396 RepID=A0AAV0QLH6_9ROSI|nr:unnamed protein product [Linum tenue]CAI0545974.1 unnamed protein product [Linum tenue]CAI0545976.1 unnamed protein product [Linum tenue]CAI0545980.1 unnamed protein product [Linum tenue]